LVYLIKKIKRKAHTGKEIIKITFGVIVVIIIIFSIAERVIKTKDLNMIDALYVNQTKIKIAYKRVSYFKIKQD
jgi:hypothetical protein